MNFADATRPEISCRATISICMYFESQLGHARLEQSIGGIATGVGLDYLLVPGNFLSYEYVARFLEVLTDESGDPDFAKNAGRFLMGPQALGYIYYMFRATATPRLAYQKLVELGPTYNRVGEFKIDSLTDTRLLMRYRSRVTERNRQSCQVRMSQYAAVPSIWGVPEALVVEHQCQVLGAEECVYELQWQRPSRAIPAAFIGASLGAGLGALLHRFFGVSLLDNAILGAMTGAILGTLLSYRRENLHLRSQLSSQDAGLLLSMSELQARVDHIQELNQNLERRVEDRTRDLSVATTRLEAALEKQLELDRLKTRFFQNLSHELRTPLTLILAPLESLASDATVPAFVRFQHDVMRRSAQRLLSIINGLLDISRLEAGRMRLTLDDVDPSLVCQHLVESAQELALQRKVTLRYHASERLRRIPLDLDKFEKIVLNLLSNALKFTPADRGRPAEVDVTLGIAGDRLRVEVRDTGIGIPALELSNIFQRFHQVDGSEERRHSGTGIGLALVKELVEFHLGEVAVESKVGEGSVFTVTLPLRREGYPAERLATPNQFADAASTVRLDELAFAELRTRSPEATPPPTGAAGPDRLRVLIAEDSADMLAYLASILSAECDVTTAADGNQAFERAVELRPDLIISDIMMPGRNGYALVRDLRARAETATVPILLMSARTDSSGREECLKAGANDYITKPFSVADLKDRIAQLSVLERLARSSVG